MMSPEATAEQTAKQEQTPKQTRTYTAEEVAALLESQKAEWGKEADSKVSKLQSKYDKDLDTARKRIAALEPLEKVVDLSDAERQQLFSVERVYDTAAKALQAQYGLSETQARVLKRAKTYDEMEELAKEMKPDLAAKKATPDDIARLIEEAVAKRMAAPNTKERTPAPSGSPAPSGGPSLEQLQKRDLRRMTPKELNEHRTQLEAAVAREASGP